MKTANRPLLIVTWLLCAAGVIAVGGMVANCALRPLASGEVWGLWPPFSAGFFILAIAAWLSRESLGNQWLVLCATLPVLGMNCIGCQFRTDEAIALLEAEAAGRRYMNCGPPFDIFLLLFSQLLSMCVLFWCTAAWWKARSRRRANEQRRLAG